MKSVNSIHLTLGAPSLELPQQNIGDVVANSEVLS